MRSVELDVARVRRCARTGNAAVGRRASPGRACRRSRASAWRCARCPRENRHRAPQRRPRRSRRPATRATCARAATNAGWLAGDEARREPALHDGVGDRGHALAAHPRDTGVPDLRRGRSALPCWRAPGDRRTRLVQREPHGRGGRSSTGRRSARARIRRAAAARPRRRRAWPSSTGRVARRKRHDRACRSAPRGSAARARASAAPTCPSWCRASSTAAASARRRTVERVGEAYVAVAEIVHELCGESARHGGQHAVDETSFDAEIVRGIEQPGKRGVVEVRARPRRVGEDVAHVTALGRGAPASVGDELVRFVAAERRRQRELHGFGEQLAVRNARCWPRMRAASTCRPATTSAIATARRRTHSTIAGSVSHSAGQLPSPRSCSCTAAVNIVATSPGTRVAAAMATDAPTGLRFCGIVDEPPRPGALGSATSPTSVCASSARSRASLPSPAVRMPSAVAHSQSASRCVCHGAGRHAEVELAGERGRDARAGVAERGQRAGGAAELHDQQPRPQGRQPRLVALERREAGRRASGRASWARPAAATCGPAASCVDARPPACASASHSRASSASMKPSASRNCSTRPVSMMSWLVAPQCT